MPDFTRLARSQRAQLWGQAFGLPVATTLFAALGMLITSAATAVYNEPIWDPTSLLTRPQFAHPLVELLSLVTLVVATLSVNVAANLVSPAFGIAHLWPQKIGYRAGASIAGALAVFMQPWFLLEGSGDLIPKFLVGYSALLGPIAGIMVCDYWVLRRTRLSVPDLYAEGGRYAYAGGFNQCALSALLAGLLPNLPGFILHLQAARLGLTTAALVALQPTATQTFWSFASGIYAFAWILGFVTSFCFYAAMMRIFESDQVRLDRIA
jgi:NCS1 family nucleobase:cation symporter-1